VTEDYKDKSVSISGAAVKTGYNSHYVVTTQYVIV
jgi:hypothetical protein